MLSRKNYINIKTIHSISLTLSDFLSFDSHVFIFFVFCVSSNNRSNHWRCSVKKGVLRNFAKFIGKHLCKSFFFNKVAGLRPATLLKKRLWHRCFLVNFAKFLRTPFLQNTSERLLLYIRLFSFSWKVYMVEVREVYLRPCKTSMMKPFCENN